jgi:hypothetical protein
MVSFLLKITIFIVLESANFCLFVKQENKGTLFIVSAFVEYYYNFIFFNVCLYKAGLMTKKVHYFLQTIDAVLEHLKRRASYPKVCPLERDLISF